jgi:putative hemolysin
MQISAIGWLLFNFLTLFLLAFFSMLEMACVSFNKIRLQYYYSKGNKRAIWLNYLLHNPSRLFGTTLIVVNFAMVMGSECAREFHSAIGLDPDLAPLSQVILVVVFGELAPIFAARRYPEHVAMLGVPFVYFTAKLMTPLLWILSGISKVANYLVGGRESAENFYISQEELQKLLEEQDETKPLGTGSEDFDTITSNIFKLREKTARQIMIPINKIQTIGAQATVLDARRLMAKTKERFLPIYLRDSHNVIGIAFPRDLIRAPDNKRLRDYCRPPWFITQNTNVLQILKQFKSNNESVAVVLDDVGRTAGIISLDNIMEAIFGKAYRSKDKGEGSPQLIIDRTFPGTMTVKEFEDQFDIKLADDPSLTLAELIMNTLGHMPEEGESIYIDPFEIAVKETSLMEIRAVSVITKQI